MEINRRLDSGDFSERELRIIEQIIAEFNKKYPGE
jgi:hypothetical protein